VGDSTSNNLDLRVRLLGAVGRRVRALNIERMSEADILRAQTRRLPRNRLTDAILGSAVAGVAVRDHPRDPATDRPPLRIYTPAGCDSVRPLVVYYHGGGWTLGTLEVGDWLCSSVSARLGAVVVSVGYRLAPRHRFPAAVDDCQAGLRWAASNASALGCDPDRLAVMGDSAGGNLAAVTCLAARDGGALASTRIRHQALLYPATDLTLASASIDENARGPILTRANVLAFRDHYLGPEGDGSDHRASPLLAPDLSGLPPALIQTARHDPLRDDGARYATRLAEAGVEIRCTEYTRSPHGFYSFPRLCREAPHALDELVAEQGRFLA
jgi:acetyl esterase